jgi:hypothetical protein
MKLPRRKFLHLAAGAVTLQAVSRIAMRRSVSRHDEAECDAWAGYAQ